MCFCKNRGFTLLELLVVATIISLLVMIIAPALSNARNSARSVVCMSRLRQLSIASINYTAANNEYYPIAYYNQSTSTEMVSYCWDFISKKDWNVSPPETEITPGLLWAYTDSGEVQQCPGYRGNSNWLSDPYTGYNYNTSYIGGGSGESTMQPAKDGQVKHPCATLIFGDGEYAGGANKFMRAPQNRPDDRYQKDNNFSFNSRVAGTQGFRHNKKTNIAFCDSHVKSTGDIYSGGHDDLAEGTGFICDDNSMYDLR